MLPEIECVKVTAEILKALDIAHFVIRLNHRQLLNGLLEACEVPQDKFKTICSAIDKLDKVKRFFFIYMIRKLYLFVMNYKLKESIRIFNVYFIYRSVVLE